MTLLSAGRRCSPATAWLLSAGLLSGGCTNMNHAQSGALMGSGIGALAGSAVGSESGHGLGGAAVGAIAGAMAGGLIGDSADARDERDLALVQRDGAIAQAQYLQAQQGLTNFDLIRLSQSRVGDDVIVNMIQTRGGQFELGTDAIIALKSNGVSDRVIVAAQAAPRTGVVTPAAGVQPPVIVAAPPPAVIVAPGPPMYWGGWRGPPPPPPRRHGGGVDLFFGF